MVGALRELKRGDGPMLLTQGSSELVHLLLEHDLVDELRLLVYPVVLGRGKRLFAEGSAPRALTLARSTVSPKGVIITTYERAGEVRTRLVRAREPQRVTSRARAHCFAVSVDGYGAGPIRIGITRSASAGTSCTSGSSPRAPSA